VYIYFNLVLRKGIKHLLYIRKHGIIKLPAVNCYSHKGELHVQVIHERFVPVHGVAIAIVVVKGGFNIVAVS